MDMTEIHAMLDEAIRESIRSDPSMEQYHEWTYRDLPRLTHKLMEEFKQLVGEENLYWITYADYGKTVRGQVLISPDGMTRITNHLASTE